MRFLTPVLLAILVIFNLSCSSKKGSARKPASQEFIFISNNARLKRQLEDFGEGFKRNIKDFRKKAKLAKLPWTGDYWPTWRGGITYRWMNDIGFKRNANCPQRGEDPARWGYKLLDMDNIPKGFNLACLSPAEKFDLFMEDRNWTLTKIERERTGILKTVPGTHEYDKKHEIPKWEGLCHAWAPLTYTFNEPKPFLATNYKGRQIPFGSSDLKALMAFGVTSQDPIIPDLQPIKNEFVGKRCALKSYQKMLEENKISRNDYIKHLVEYCEQSVNPAAFHIIITNMVGLRSEGFIMDRTWDDEVWNQPVYSYEYVSRPFQARIPESAPRGTSRFIHVKMMVKMVGERGSTWKGGPKIKINPKYKNWKENELDPRDPTYEDRWKIMAKNMQKKGWLWIEDDKVKSGEEIVDEYEYILALDYSGNVIGGKWYGKSERKHPDFIWKQTIVAPFEGILQNLGPLYKSSMKQEITALNKFVASVDKFQRIPMRFLRLYKKLFSEKHRFSLFFHNEIINSYNEKRKPNMLKINFWSRHGAQTDKLEFLIVAIRTKNQSLLKLLLKKSTHLSDPAVMENAATAGDLEIVSMLLAKNASISKKAVENSIMQGNGEILEVLLDYSGINPNAIIFDYNEGGVRYMFPAIHQAANIGNKDILRVLLERGGNQFINEPVRGNIQGDGDSILIFTLRGVTMRREEPSADTIGIIKLLVDAGGDLHGRTKSHYNLKTIANRLKGPFAAIITKYLIEHGVQN